MADLKALIRYRKHTLDEKQRAMAALFREVEKLEGQKQGVYNQIEIERKMADEMQSVEAAVSLGLFMDGARQKIEALDRSILRINQKIDKAREAVREAFAEVKKIEITQRRREEKEAADVLKKENATLDEIGIELHRRKAEEISS